MREFHQGIAKSEVRETTRKNRFRQRTARKIKFHLRAAGKR